MMPDSQSTHKRKSRSRPNGTGTAIKRGKTWTAVVVVGWKPSEDRTHKIPVYRTKGGFQTKKEALNYCSVLLHGPEKKKQIRLHELYDLWEAAYATRIVPSTMDCYKYAYKHFANLHHRFISNISATDLQACMDACPSGKRTHQNMKCVAGLLWAYAIDSNYITQDVTEHLYIGKGQTVQRDPLTEKEVEAIRRAIGKIRYAEYVYCLCYLGFRPTEFLSLKKAHYKIIDGIECLINGSKTEAGKDRIVIIPPQILDYVRARMYVPGTDLIFPQYVFSRKKGEPFKCFKEMHHSYFREDVFKPMMQQLGIAEGKVPYATRHTYSDKLKRADGDDKTKAGLMGHTDYAFTKSHYQSTDMDDLLDVATSIE